ncbi:MAG: bifunctional hydroxymethylpyrimidine kinase/phosphomethylpyrimidine kinase [Cyanobacteria bacterium SZAS-4]|nr:bifunctional hydroxymethylpyrimidine kinase/phosphomethylpyrimidine kinase [Cyanobacteria bacterium SZAS-4]
MTNPYDPKPDSTDQNQPTQPEKEGGEKQRLSLDDLVSREAKALVTFEQSQAAQQKLPGNDLNKYIGKGLTPELGRELSGQKASPSLGEQPPREFKWSGTKDIPIPSKANSFVPGGPQFLQMRKSEFAKPDEKPVSELKVAVDNFLKNTAHKEDKSLTAAEILELEQTRLAIETASNTDDLLSNTLHLARLYQHLRYIDEAKQAVEFSLGIDPEHMLGKQVFSELERMHPADMGSTTTSTPYAVTPPLTKSVLRKRIQSLSGGRVIVIGDLLIDELLEGKPERISREAPVLILEHVDTELIPGGAANTAHNISALGGICHAIGVCGNDEYANKLAAVLEGCGITHALVKDATRPTTVKTRIVSKSHSLMQQLLRLDRISHEPLSKEVENQLVTKLRNATTGYKAIVLSDYRAGVISESVIQACRDEAKKTDILVIVDAQGDFSRFKDVTLMTPNQPDTEKAVGYSLNNREDLRRAGDEILKETNATSLLVTRGPHGMALFQKGKEMVEIPVFNRSDVFDVTGAGDTVVATMALALVSGSTFVEAMALGNLAAGIVVRKSGTAVTSQKEMIENLERLNLPEN